MEKGPPYDLFVSYAHVDNQDGWVETFVAKLEGALAIRNGGVGLNVYRDKKKIKANSVLNDMLDAARQSHMFLVVGSRAYVSSERFTLRELAAFHGAAQDESRICVIETLPLREGEAWPEPIANHTPQAFFICDEIDDTASRLTFELHGSRYQREIDRLADVIISKLGQMSAASAPSASHPPVADSASQRCSQFGPDFECKRVLIAQPTDALEDEVADLRSYLAKFGIETLPRTPYPQGGIEFKAAFYLDLDRADLVVNLLDRRTGRCPPDLAEGYTMFQLNAARKHGVEIMQWRDPRIDPAEIADDEFREVLNGPEVIACGFNEFRETVRKAAIKPVAKNRPTNGVTVYVHASPRDRDVARRVSESCGRYKLYCDLPEFDQRIIKPEEVKELIVENNAVLLLSCNADTSWVRREAKTVFKYAERQDGQIVQLVALCFAPPEKSEMVVFPDARIIKGMSESELIEQIDMLLRELAA